MKRRGEDSGGPAERSGGAARKSRQSLTGSDWRMFPIGPVLVHYGGEDPPEGYSKRPYRCPFHGDSNASASVSTVEGEEQWFNCHTGICPTGNAVQIIMKQENTDFGSAIERAAEISGESYSPVRQKSRSSRGVPSGSRSRDGVRAFKRSRRGD